MIATMARETGATGLILGGFYSVTVASLICPPVGVGIVLAGMCWLYGRSKR